MEKEKTNIGLKNKSTKNAQWYNYPYKITLRKYIITEYSKPVTYVIHQP